MLFEGYGAREDDDLYVEEWINSIENNEQPDRLTKHDRTFLGQIGGRGNRFEYMYGTFTKAPLWEFRDLVNLNSAAIAAPFTVNVLRELRNYHNIFRDPNED